MNECVYYRRTGTKNISGLCEFKTSSLLSSYIDMEELAREIAYSDFNNDWEDEDVFSIEIFQDKNCQKSLGEFSIKVNKVNSFWATEVFS